MNPSFQNQFTQKQSVMPPIQGLNSPMANWGNMNASNFNTGALNTGVNTNPGGMNSQGFGLGTQFGQFGGDVLSPIAGQQTQPPAKVGGWTDPTGKGGMALGVAQVGLGVYNAMEQSKMNKFMKSYYGDQMDLMKTDFANAARGSNEALASRQERVLSAQGTTTGTDANRQGVADYMAQWGARETV